MTRRHSREIEVMLHSFAKMRGYPFGATDGNIGALDDLYFDHTSTLIRYLVVDTGTWLSGRKLLLAPAAIGGVDADAGTIVTGLTRQQVEDSPHIDTAKPVSRRQEIALHQHYDWEPYWAAPPPAASLAPYWGAAMPAVGRTDRPSDPVTQERAAAESARVDPDLRSASEVVGCRVGALDGDIGHVEDFLIDDDIWAIQLLVIDTRNWLPGRKVVIAPQSLRAVDWTGRRIAVDLTREQIEGSSDYDPALIPDRSYLERLLAHYGLSR